MLPLPKTMRKSADGALPVYEEHAGPDGSRVVDHERVGHLATPPTAPQEFRGSALSTAEPVNQAADIGGTLSSLLN
jgi:hypothetical protein